MSLLKLTFRKNFKNNSAMFPYLFFMMIFMQDQYCPVFIDSGKVFLTGITAKSDQVSEKQASFFPIVQVLQMFIRTLPNF